MAKMLKGVFFGLLTVALGLAALIWYFIYTPEPDEPALSGVLTRGAIESGGAMRSYFYYAPIDLPPGAPLVLVLHGSGGSGAQIRKGSGYGFDRLADRNQFAVVYPDAFEGFWNGCNAVGDYSANTLDIDDVGFLTALAGRLADEIGTDPEKSFAVGVSRGGHMAFRLAIEAPDRFRAVAAVAANIPTPENFKCTPAPSGAISVMIINGTKDPLNPYGGGDVALFGMYKRGKVLSSRQSAEYFAMADGLGGAPDAIDADPAGGRPYEILRWRSDAGVDVELVSIVGGGHALPLPSRRAPRILGPTVKSVDGPLLIWSFFERRLPP